VRYLAVDLGDKRTGIAAGDDVTRIVSPVDVIDVPRATREADLIRAVAARAREHEAHAIVLGLPLNMDGSEGERAKIVRAFGAKVAHAAALPIHFQDERLTSHAAEEHLKQSGRTHGQKQAIRDALAAVVILQDFLATRSNSDRDGPV
jgi:putative Holliday junction resolvase